MTALLVTDTHFTDKPSDEYRWGVYPWLREQVGRTKATEVIHLGDITDAKDRHTSKLVNRFVDQSAMLSDMVHVYHLKGNHDYIEPQNPFFRFIENSPNMSFYRDPHIAELSIGKALFVPSGTKWNFRPSEVPYLFTHVTFDGAEAENGSLLPGVDPALLKDYDGKCYSGDIHVPQKIRKNIEYVGAPYHIRFGDIYMPRVLAIFDDGTTEDLRYPAPYKRVLEAERFSDLTNAKVREGDHVKVRYYLRRAEYDTWRVTKQKIRELAEANKWVLFGIEAMPLEVAVVKREAEQPGVHVTKEQLIDDYAKRYRLSDEFIAIGKELAL